MCLQCVSTCVCMYICTVCICVLLHTLPSCVQSTALCQLDNGTCTNCIDCFNLHHLFKDAVQTVGGTEMSAPHI